VEAHLGIGLINLAFSAAKRHVSHPGDPTRKNHPTNKKKKKKKLPPVFGISVQI
jgi:hypothetical protein